MAQVLHEQFKQLEAPNVTTPEADEHSLHAELA